MNIIASLPDLEYGKKHREGIYVSAPSKWEWGLGDDDQLYCRDEAKGSIITEWFLVGKLPVYVDMATIHKLSKWSNSIALKSKVRSLQDKGPVFS